MHKRESAKIHDMWYVLWHRLKVRWYWVTQIGTNKIAVS